MSRYTAGDPGRPNLLWTNLSRRRIRAARIARGFRIGVKTVARLLRRHGFGRRKAQKKRPSGTRHPERDRPFYTIARRRVEYERSPNPIISADTKKKAFIGNLYREGRLDTQATVHALDHDSPTAAEGVTFPHGIYDVKKNIGHINLGTSHDTSRFAGDSIGRWWEHYGRSAYPEATSILMPCDGGGSNSSRRDVFQHRPELLADRRGEESARPTTRRGARSTTRSSIGSSRT